MIAWLLIALIFSLEFAALFKMLIYQVRQSIKNKEKDPIGAYICETALLIIGLIAIVEFIIAILTEYHSSF